MNVRTNSHVQILTRDPHEETNLFYSIRAGSLALLAMLVVAAPLNAQTQNLNVSIENNQTAGGFYLTPLFFGVHDGSFDFFDANVGSMSSTSLQALAENGDVSGLNNDFDAAHDASNRSVVTGPAGFGSMAGQPPVLDPTEIGMTSITINDTSNNQFFSFATMVIPTNDAFIGNDSGTAHQIFDSAGNFTGPVTIQIFGSSIYDSGTEVNDENGGAAFSANGGDRADEFLTVRSHPGLGNFVGTFTAAGTEITSDIGQGELLATITITQAVPEPGSLAILGIGSAMMVMRRRSRS